jgi:integrase
VEPHPEQSRCDRPQAIGEAKQAGLHARLRLIERLRVAVPSERDRRLLSMLAYSGLRPGEALALESADIGMKTISVTRAIKLDGPGDTKTHKAHSISLLLFSTYAHVIAKLRGAAPISAEEQIRAARSTIHDEDA